eukprot:1606516-Ditylum_brightwellii.AAC.1
MNAWHEGVDEQSFINCRVKISKHCYEESIIGDESNNAINKNSKDDNESNVKWRISTMNPTLNTWHYKLK